MIGGQGWRRRAPAVTRLRTGALLIAAAGAWFQGAGAAEPGIRVRVATLNLENYLALDRVLPGGYRPDYPKPEAEKAALRRVLREVRPDVLAVQEIGGRAYLLELQRDLRAEGLSFPFTALMEAADKERKTAVLSRLPFAQIRPHADLDFKYFDGREPVERGLLEVVFVTAGTRWSLFNLHLKSRYTERRDDPEGRRKRTGEATAARERIKRLHPPGSGARYLIAGDLNDTKNSAPVRRFLRSGGHVLAELVPCADSRGETWTYHYAKEDVYSRVDYLLASPALVPHLRGGRGSVAEGDAMALASDHRLVYCDLLFPAQ